MAKLNFQQPLLQSSTSHDTSEIILLLRLSVCFCGGDIQSLNLKYKDKSVCFVLESNRSYWSVHPSLNSYAICAQA